MKTWMDRGAQAACLVVSLAGLAVAGWVLIAGLPGREGIDAMFLLVVALAFAAFFGMIPLRAILRRDSKLSAQGGTKTEAPSDRSAKA